MDRARVLIVDDEPDIRELLSLTLAKMKIECVTASNLQEAKECLTQWNYFLCLVDMRLPDGDGISFVEYIQENRPDLPVAVITAYSNVEGAVNTLKAGAFDYVSKPVDLQMLRDLVNAALRLSKGKHLIESSPNTLLGQHAVMNELRKKITKLARSQAPVFISGESGSGKELVARLVHAEGPRQDKPFVPINCGAIPSELLESEFFGHVKGSFTGAIKDKAGLFQIAHGGTLFLDEIADLPLAMQVKLLRAIQEKSIRPIGATQEISVDVRILSASHKNLLELVAAGKFRQDLYYRINVIELPVPSLRDRVEDIPLLTQHFLSTLVDEEVPVTIEEEALSKLSHYNFPGNVRELENILERAAALCEHHKITSADLRLPQCMPLTSERDNNLDGFLDDQARHQIEAALRETNGNRTKAAKLLGISFRAMRYRLKKFGIE